MALSPGSAGCGILTGVVAFVDVWSSNRTENYSKMFSQQLLSLGAKVSKTLSKQVTHVVFKDGSQSTWDKAVKNKVKLVSVLWVEKCRETTKHVEESLYLAINTNNGLPELAKKKRKCMQPKDFVEKTPENDKRLAKKFDKMCKRLDDQKASIDIPLLSFDDDGTLLYSPKAVVADRCNAMERRVQEMKHKRENLSPTASQMSQTFDFSSLKPSLGNTPSGRTDSPHEDDSGCLNASYDELFPVREGSVPSTPKYNKIHVVKEDPDDSVGSKSSLSPQRTDGRKSSPQRVMRRSGTRAKCRKSSLFKPAGGTNASDRPTLVTINDDPDFDFTPMANNAVCKLGFDAMARETTNSAIQISRKNLKSDNKVKAAHNIMGSDSGSDAFSETASEKGKISGLDYSSMANRLIALCHEKEKSKKTGRRSSKSEVPISCAKDKAVKVKPRLSSCNADSADTFSNFEDFFTSSDLNNRQSKLSPFSLTIEPRRSPSPPPLTSNGKDCRKRRGSMGAAQQETCAAKKRKTIHSLTPSASSPSEGPRKCASSTTKRSLVPAKSKAIICESKSELAENGNKPEMTSVKNTISPAPCKKLQDAPGVQETLHLTNGTDHGKELKLCQPSVESKTSVSDAIDGLSEMFNEQRNKFTEESRKIERSRKVTRSLVMTSMSTEKQSTIIQVVKKFGGFVFSDEVCETTTHVIAGSPRRTLNIILGIARGCWIVSYDWVLWSLERGHWMPEEPYELSDYFPGAPICRLQHHLSAGEYHQDLFSNVPAIFISPNSQPPCEKLSDVVQLCGGKVCKTLRPAKVCIGMFPGKKPPDLECVSEKWLLDSITQYKLLPLQNYLLE
ncbi:microcephalin [Bufo gargarizans]|uniref:microcephalin n=1 Tax=Bufo gargarizans TaxID=30331 RepID=UPI001CF13365|nr:microcephalin [Bufo gargarizans]